jgi:TonB-linked SusC/RagA family outer membrane protein
MKKTILLIVLAALCPFLKLTAQNNTHTPTTVVNGKVVDEQGNPLPGATVKLKLTNNGVITDKEGKFTISHIPAIGTLTISFIGYQVADVNYDNTQNGFLTIQLKADANSLNEVQVIGYGTTTKRLNTGSVSTITAEDIEKQPVSDPISALQGRASGVSIQTNNGLPGGNITVQIRGQGSIASGTAPLYIVDGVPFISTPLITGSGTGATGAISPLSILNPDDIESITILKDADATAIYGSRAANGVILITTKKGTAGKTSFQVNANQGFSEISRYPQLLSLPQYLEMRREAFKNDGITPTTANAPDLTVWSQTQGTDWQKYMFGHKAEMTNIQTSLSGGDANTNFLFSTNYRNEGSILPGDENFKKGGGFLKVTHTSPDKRFTANFTANYELDDDYTLLNATTVIAQLPPNYPVYNQDGTLNFESGNNPMALLQQHDRTQSNNLIVNGLLQYELFKGLIIKTSLGYTKYSIQQLSTEPSSSQDNTFFTPSALAVQANNSNESYIIEPQINYSVKIKRGTLTALIGSTLQNQVMQGNTLIESGVNNPALLGNLSAASTITGSNSYSQYKYVSLFSRVNYDWQQEYIVDLNFRRDGSSRFGNNKQFGDFGAAGGAWVFSQENLIRDQLPFLSFGKLRSSYGVTGNDQIPDYQYLTAYGSSTIYGGTASLAPSRIANPNYSWETTHQLETALELGFLKDRIMLTIAWYQRRSENQLVLYPLPYQSGFSSYQANLPAIVQNTGLEFDLSTINIKSKEVSWTSTFNLTIPKNVLVSYPNLAASTYANTLVVGQDLSIVKGTHFLGVNPQTGLAQFEDVNHDGVISPTTDAVIIGKTSPTFYGGFGNTVSYHGFKMDIFLEFRKQNSRLYQPAYGAGLENEPISILGRWQQVGDQTNVPRFTSIASNLTNLAGSSSTFGDASYLRVKNVSLSYNFSSSFIKKLNIKNLSLFLEGQNVLTFANNNKFDPEILGGLSGIPPLRTFVAGLKITL